MTKSIRVLPIFFVLALAGCTHNPANLGADIAEADKKCSLQPKQEWPNMVAAVSCRDFVELPVIKKDNPILLQSYETFSSKRKLLAQQYDDEKVPTIEAWKIFKQGETEAQAVLLAQEPKWATENSTLNKDIIAANPDKTCASSILVTRMKCFDSIMHPIWERDASDSLEYYEEFNKKRLQLAKKYDAVGVPKIAAAASDNFQRGIKTASNEFIFDVRQTVQQQQISNAQAANEQARNRAQTADAIGNIAQILLQGVAGAAQTRANSDVAALNSSQHTTVVIQNSSYAPPSNHPMCSSYCQIMIQTGNITANDPCAVQCAH